MTNHIESEAKMETVSSEHGHHVQQRDEDQDYRDLLHCVRIANTRGPFFMTDAEGLFDLFLAGLPPERRAHYTCRECRRFFERYGGLVTLTTSGGALPLFWAGAEHGSLKGIFAKPIVSIEKRVAHSKVTGVFLAAEQIWGNPESETKKAASGSFHHFCSAQHQAAMYKPTPLKSASQAMAEKREDRGSLGRALAEFKHEHIQAVVQLLTADQLGRSEKHEGMAKWFLKLHEDIADKKGAVKDNIIWLAVANAAPGFCHISNTVVGTLLEDVKAGLSFPAIKRKYDEKVHPLQYMRPQAAPTVGQIEQAEAVVAKLGIGPALARRYAKLEDCEQGILWRPAAILCETGEPSSVFAHLKAKADPKPDLHIPPTDISWRKFQEIVVADPNVVRMEFQPRHGQVHPFFAFCTATDPDAPPVLQWDSVEHRAPVNWYLYHGGSMGRAWNLTEGAWVQVNAIVRAPNQWAAKLDHIGDGAYFILDGCRDVINGQAWSNFNGGFRSDAGLALFPEELKTELHAIRSVIEAASKAGKLSGQVEATACGVCIQKHPGDRKSIDVFRITMRNGLKSSYRLIRWD